MSKINDSSAVAEWNGDLPKGNGAVRAGTGAFNLAYTFASRFEKDRSKSNPEELIAAAHAGCYSMALAGALGKAGHPPTSIKTRAIVTLERVAEKPTVTLVRLEVEGNVPGIDKQAFKRHAEEAKAGCPISRLLAPGTRIELAAELK